MSPVDHLAWRTASYSSAGQSCVEVAPVEDGVLVRDTKHRAAGVIAFSRREWSAFLASTTDTK